MLSSFQLSLNTFLGASEQAVANLSPKKVIYKSKTFMDHFRELPVEIRCTIYSILFKGATLVVDYEGLRDAAPTDRLKANSVSIDGILKMVTNHKAALLIANEWCKEEAVDILAQNTTIEFTGLEPNNDIRDDILATIDHNFLSHVTKIVIPPINFLRANRSLLPKLKEIRLFHLHIYEFEHDLFIRHLLCPGCGDPSDQWLYSACKSLTGIGSGSSCCTCLSRTSGQCTLFADSSPCMSLNTHSRLKDLFRKCL